MRVRYRMTPFEDPIGDLCEEIDEFIRELQESAVSEEPKRHLLRPNISDRCCVVMREKHIGFEFTVNSLAHAVSARFADVPHSAVVKGCGAWASKQFALRTLDVKGHEGKQRVYRVLDNHFPDRPPSPYWPAKKAAREAKKVAPRATADQMLDVAILLEQWSKDMRDHRALGEYSTDELLEELGRRARR